MDQMHQSSDNKFIPVTSFSSGKLTEVTDDIAYYTNQVVNLVFIGKPGQDNWIMVDTGMPKCGDEILEVAEARFGKGSKPAAILLTHGHFDHVGNIVHLLQHWDVPVFAHALEFPFLTGKQPYPAPDPTVEGGLLAKISFMDPSEPIDIAEKLQVLPAGGEVPFLPDWRWIHVPGHAPGQVAFFRQADRMLLSADAVVTVRQDSFYKVLIQDKEVNGPPRYFTTDWNAAKASAGALRALQPLTMISGHGTFMQGEELTTGLDKLVSDFDTLAVPSHGKYV